MPTIKSHPDIGKDEVRGVNLTYVLAVCGALILGTWQFSMAYNELKNELKDSREKVQKLDEKVKDLERDVKIIKDLQNTGKLK